MPVEADLHLHTTCSDGRLTPTQLIELIASKGIKAAAVSDHDSTEGLAEAYLAAKRFPGLRIIPAIELSTDIPGDEIHILGYFMDYANAEFQANLGRFRDAREGRARAMVDKLRSIGIMIEFERVRHFAGDAAMGRPHVALALLEKGYVKEFPEAFDKYIGRNGPAYVERPKLTPEDSIGFVRQFGGAAVVAHPRDLKELDATLGHLKAAGLSGMEVYYAEYGNDQIAELARLASKHDLIPCGGSDYHHLGKPNEKVPGLMGPPLWVVDALEKAAQATRSERK